MTDQGDEVLIGRAPTQETEFFCSWGRETLKNNLTRANDALQRLITLNMSALGGGLVFFEKVPTAPWAKIIGVAFFLVSLVIAVFGSLPYEGTADLRMPQRIRQHKEAALKSKLTLLGWANGLLLGGLGIVLLGLVTYSIWGR